MQIRHDLWHGGQVDACSVGGPQGAAIIPFEAVLFDFIQSRITGQQVEFHCGYAIDEDNAIIMSSLLAGACDHIG